MVTPNVLPVEVEDARAVTWRPVLKKIVSFLTGGEVIEVVLSIAASSRVVGEVVIFLLQMLVRLQLT